ncbi:iron chaperone [Nocardioides sp.]|uniref:iron chaperone n=1 Tax=Nocardioides sp. TaxID=35761 RepID=UPI002733D83F|nr:DUF1801 domain-containing protein [Nocardioides sp.]MDP3894854.1 DUF1801 domain-containing protein [Nocardioides sp.]
MATTKNTTQRSDGKSLSATGFTDAERAAMKERADELRAQKRGGKKKSDDAHALLAKIAEMEEPDRTLAERIHTIITTAAPDLAPKTWYGMPAYAKDGKVLCFFQAATKFERRYATLGFNDPANLDQGTMWPTAFALTDLTDADAKKVEDLGPRHLIEHDRSCWHTPIPAPATDNHRGLVHRR